MHLVKGHSPCILHGVWPEKIPVHHALAPVHLALIAAFLPPIPAKPVAMTAKAPILPSAGDTMKNRLAFVLTSFLTAVSAPVLAAEETPTEDLIQSAAEVELSNFLWLNRPVVVFADTDRDPRFVQQMDLINALSHELVERDVVVLVDTDPAAKSPLREQLRPRGFMLVVIGKDGNPYLRKPFPWNVREISASIDKMPMRQQEMRDSHGN
jgi:hypothetical protein